MKRFPYIPLVALMALTAAPSSAQILTNGSFEAGLTGWSTFNPSSVAIAPAIPYSNQDGSNVVQLPASSFAGLIQLFTLTPNTNYTFSALVAGDTVGDDSVIRFLLADSGFGVGIDQRSFTVSATTIGTAMTGISYSFNSGTISSAGLQIDTFTAGGAAPRVIYLDSVTITPAAAPEPGTLLLVALGGTFVVFRRRK